MDDQPRRTETVPIHEGAFERWRRSLVHLTGLGLSSEEVRQRELHQSDDFLQKQRQSCLLWRNELLRSSKALRTLYSLGSLI